MADSKSTKSDPKNNPLTPLRSPTPSKPAAKTPPKTTSGKPALKPVPKPDAKPAQKPPRRKPSAAPVKLVERKKLGPDEQGGPAIWRFLKDPERVGSFIFDRPMWIDELTAIILIVGGLVTLLSLLNTSSIAVLSNMWSDTIRQLVGYVGAIILSIMIISAGVIIMLPKIGIVIHMLWTRIVQIEIAYFSFLALLHLLAHDPEPRALARSGQGGGYVGWALSEVVSKLFGSVMATVFFALLTVFLLGLTIGIRRKHVRQWVDISGKQSLILANRLKNLPPRMVKNIRKARPVLSAARVRRIADLPAPQNMEAPLQVAEPSPVRVARIRQAEPGRRIVDEATSEPELPPVKLTPVKTPRLQTPPIANASVPVSVRPAELPALEDDSELPMTPPKPSTPVPLRASKVVPNVQNEPVPLRTSKTSLDDRGDEDEPIAVPVARAATPAPIPERRTRYFTVEDFKEIRQPIKRDNLPPLELLNDTELNKPTEQEINTNARVIENTLLDFDIDVEVVDVKVGPSVTQYAVQPFREVTNEQGATVTQRVRVNKIASLSGDLALALAAKRLRIQPYVPGYAYMGIEVPNRVPSIVALRPVMESEAFARAFVKPDPEAPGQTREVPLAVPLGRDVSGAAVVVDLAAMPHLLIAGTTGSGKSVCITAMAVSLAMNNRPDRLKLVMLDPKMVELVRFNGLPHLLGPVETDMERIIGVLRWATREMDQRYKLLEAEASRNIEAYNRILINKGRQAEQLPYIAIIVDEIGDMMLSRPEEMERTLTRLAQMARAVGMHLVVATQRPSVDIITGLIKANFPARISFAVASGMDSRVILDTTGAETLMGRGDMLYQAPDAAAPKRIQGCFVSDPEIDAVVNYWKKWSADHPHAGPGDESAPWERGMTRREALSETDSMLEDAIALVVRDGSASTSLIQRQLGIPYPRAAHLLDLMNELGILGASKDGGRTREVLLKPGTDPYKKLMNKSKRG